MNRDLPLAEVLPEADRAGFAAAALAGLGRQPKAIPCVWLYDQHGSALFERITGLPEYYPTRSEIALLRRHAGEIAALIGDAVVVVEIGSGSSRKTPLLLGALDRPRAYVPVDIAAHCLDEAVQRLRRQFAQLPMHPLLADFNAPLELPAAVRGCGGRRLGFFPGSTIGNLTPGEARAFLGRMATTLGPHGLMLIGVDSNRDPDTLIPAYDDAAGVTAAFNLNLLHRINRELAGDIDPTGFSHQARFDHRHGRIEMHLVSRRSQTATVLGRRVDFRAGESIHTENAYKYRIEDFQALARSAGWQPERFWLDQHRRFALHLLHRPVLRRS